MSVQVQTSEPRVYDFRHPVRVTSTVRARLLADQKNLARALAASFTDRLGVGCDVALQEVAEGPSDRLFETAFDPVFSLSSPATSGQILLHMQAPLAQAFVERLLGGMGANRDVEREATEVEAALLQLVAVKAREALAQVWKCGVERGPDPAYMGADARHASPVIEGVAAQFEFKTADAHGVLQLFYAHDVITGALGLDSDIEAAPEAAGTSARMTFEHVSGVRVRLRARWPPTPMQIRDLAGLRVGDVVHLDHKLSDEIEILVGDRVAFRGHPGAVEEALGIQITRAL